MPPTRATPSHTACITPPRPPHRTTNPQSASRSPSRAAACELRGCRVARADHANGLAQRIGAVALQPRHRADQVQRFAIGARRTRRVGKPRARQRVETQAARIEELARGAVQIEGVVHDVSRSIRVHRVGGNHEHNMDATTGARARTTKRTRPNAAGLAGFSFPRHAGAFKIPRSSTLSAGTPMRSFAISIVAAVILAAPAHAETIADRWNLAEIYTSVAAWNADAAKVEGQLKDLAGCKGHMGDSAARFKQCLDLQADMTKRYYRLGRFPANRLAEDTGNPAYLELDQKADVLGNISARRPPSSIPRSCTSARTASRSSSRGSGALHLPVPARPDAAPRAAYAQRRGRGAGREIRADGQRRRIRLHDPHQRRHPVAEGEALQRRGDHARRIGVHEIPRAAEPRRSQEGHGRVLRHVQDLRAHDRRQSVFAAEAERRLREGAQLPGLDHARTRPE